MSQVSQYTAADGSGLSVRTALNAILAAIASSNSGTTAPASPFAGLFWCNTNVSPRTLNVYDDVSASWITIAYLETNGVWSLIEPQADARYLKLAGGTLTGDVAGTGASFTSITVNGISVNSASILTSGLVAAARLGNNLTSARFLYTPDGSTVNWTTVAFTDVQGTIASAQVPLAPISQWQASLSIASSQLTGTINANELEGYVVNGNGVASTIAVRDGGGYLWAVYFNQSSPQNENPPVAQVAVNNGSDGFWRKAGIAYFAEQVFGQINADPSNPGYVVIPNGMGGGRNLVVQWGQIYLGDIPANGTISGTATFPVTLTSLLALATGTRDANGGLGSYVWNTIEETASYVSFGAHEIVNVLQEVYFRFLAIGY
jgi:hypothetical protein